MRVKMPHIRGKTILLVLVLLYLLFFFGLRPYWDRQNCYQYAVNQVKDYGPPTNDRLFEQYGRHYTLCVNRSGLGE